MALYPALTGWPTDADMARARTELAEARRIGLRTARERAYVDAASAFFRDSPALTARDRLRAYTEALGQLRRDYPDDVDADGFYGLALIALADEEDDSAAFQPRKRTRRWRRIRRTRSTCRRISNAGTRR